jgi:hypothetical protein
VTGGGGDVSYSELWELRVKYGSCLGSGFGDSGVRARVCVWGPIYGMECNVTLRAGDVDKENDRGHLWDVNTHRSTDPRPPRRIHGQLGENIKTTCDFSFNRLTYSTVEVRQ